MNTYAVLLKLRDKPGAMESIAATFAHRGISLATILANDAASAPALRRCSSPFAQHWPGRKQ